MPVADNKAIRETLSYCLPQLIYLTTITIIIEMNQEAYETVDMIYTDVTEMYRFGSYAMWAKIINRLLKIISILSNKYGFLELNKCLDFFATFLIWG